jgi:hypothetical protein
MDVEILLADAATVNVSGNIDVLGLGWEVTGPSPLPGFVVITIVKAPLDWPEGRQIEFTLQLLDANGEVVKTPGSPSAEIGFRASLPVTPSSTRPEGFPGGVASVTGVGAGLLLEPGTYEWIVSVEGVTEPSWRRPFYVRSKPDEFPPQARMLNPSPAPTQQN